MKYTVDFRLVRKDILKLDRVMRQRILQKASLLASNPRPPGSVKLGGFSDVWRIRAGDYRILYSIQDDRLVVLVVDIGHRGDVYR